MENMNRFGIVLDGKMDEAVWQTVPEYSDFKQVKTSGGTPLDVDTFFRILPCEDRVYVGVKCMEPGLMPQHIANRFGGNPWAAPAVEIFLSPSGTSFETYQFYVSFDERELAFYYGEGGNIQPDPYAPEWKNAIYVGEDYWSVEVEIPLTAFYMTPHTRWNDTWLVNIARDRKNYAKHPKGVAENCAWCDLKSSFLEINNFRPLGGFPIRPVKNDVFISEVSADLTEVMENGYRGEMTVSVILAEGGEFTLSSGCGETVTAKLENGLNEIKAPCFFPELGRPWVDLTLTRTEDGQTFYRQYPVLAEYEPIRFKFTQPTYRTDFYPGQDYTKIAGTVNAAKPVTLTLEGPGIPATTLTPNADGSFVFETPDFQEGEAWITATTEDYETKQKVRRLAPTDRVMTWIENGNLMLNGKPVLRRNHYGPHYRGGVVFNARYDEEYEQGITYETKEFAKYVIVHPCDLIKGCEKPGGEATFDRKPSDEMFQRLDEVMEKVKDRDFTHYYLSDEPDCRNVSPVYLKYMYKYITDKDPYHVVLLDSRAASKYVDCADWFESHPYINAYVEENGNRIYGRQINTLGGFMDDILKHNRGDKCIGFVPTCFCEKYTSLSSDYPNFVEIDCHIWAAMIRGGKSLCPYAYHDINDRPTLYEGFRYAFATYDALEEMLLLAKRTTLVKTSDVESVLFELGEEKMFVVVNLQPVEQTVTLDGISGTWHNFRHDGMISGNTFHLKPFEVLIGTSEVKDAGYSTYEETEALIEKLENQRTQTKNLLFDRTGDIPVKASQTMFMYFYKVFDGVQDNLAFWMRDKGDKFVEMDLTKVKPTFTKVCIHGWDLSKMKILVGKEGELKPLEYKEFQDEKYVKTYLLDKAISPDVMRIEIPTDDTVEIYEIEVFA